MCQRESRHCAVGIGGDFYGARGIIDQLGSLPCELCVEFPGHGFALRDIRASVFPFGKIFQRFGSEAFEKLRIDLFYLRDHRADYFSGFARRVARVAHTPEAVEDDAGDGVHHGGERRYRQDVTRYFYGSLFRRAFDFAYALGVGHGADVPDIVENFSRIAYQEG